MSVMKDALKERGFSDLERIKGKRDQVLEAGT